MALGRGLPFKACAIFGGVDKRVLLRQVSRGCNIAVSTACLLLELAQLGYINFNRLRLLIIDKADLLLQGDCNDLNVVLAMMPKVYF